eukprot:GHVP01012925.1.p1 GENE.GHVP01012925.1~~GHVP01012925.1.p1  ORF type:complete len:610 (+),score=113.37 GHVP01012925.1:189-2018(+)
MSDNNTKPNFGDTLKEFSSKSGHGRTGENNSISSMPPLDKSIYELRMAQYGGIDNFFDDNQCGHWDQYEKLSSWIDNSIEKYREGLIRVLFPILIHSYLDLLELDKSDVAGILMNKYEDKEYMSKYKNDLKRIGTVIDKRQIKENVLCSLFRKNKYVVPMSRYSYDLLLYFLEENKASLMQKILNSYIQIRISYTDKEEQGIGLDDVELGKTIDSSIDVLWGKIIPPRVTDSDICSFIYTRPSRNFGEIKADQGTSPDISPDSERIPLPTVNMSEIQKEVDRMYDMTYNKSTPSPSICCYTVGNTYGGMTSLDFSYECEMAAVGSQDSYITIFSLTSDPLQKLKTSTELATLNLTDTPEFDDLFEQSAIKSRKLIGHSGAVYSTQFFHNNQFLLSSGQDSTTRLWCLKTYKNIAYYKGHQHPIWDMKTGPFGYYFLTGSADRTARLWSSERLEAVRIFNAHSSDVDTVCFHPNSNYIATGSSDRTIRLWDIQNGKSNRLFTGFDGGLRSISISPNGKLIAGVTRNSEITVFDIAEDKKISSEKCIDKRINSIKFSPQNDVLSYVSSEGSFVVYDYNKGEEISRFSTKDRNLCYHSYINSNLAICGGSFN